MDKRHKVIFLCSKLSGYFLASIETFSDSHNVECHVYCYPANKEAPFEFDNDSNLIEIIDRTTISKSELIRQTSQIKPDLVYIAGWFDEGYRKVARIQKSKGVDVVMGLDNHYKGSMRQRLLTSVIGRIWMKRHFSYIWVAGDFQYEYATRLGYETARILSGLYTADDELFAIDRVDNKRKEILFVGRLIPYKKPDELAKTFLSIDASIRKGWKLKIIGNGVLTERIPTDKSIVLYGFVQPEELARLTQSCAVFCLPSSRENWGVVVHEFAYQGMALLLSDKVGASRELLIDGYNGYRFESDNNTSMRNALTLMMKQDFSKTEMMGDKSMEIAKRFSKEEWASRLYSVISSKS